MWQLILSSLSGINWSSLVYSSRLLLLLSILGSFLYIITMLVLSAVGQQSTYSSEKSLLGTFMSLRSSKGRRIVNRWFPRIGFLIVGYVVGSVGVLSPVREWHNVTVIQRNGPREFVVNIPASANYPYLVKDERQTWRLCDDGDNLVVKPGVVFVIFQYVQRDGCQYLDQHTNVSYLRAGGDVVDSAGRKLFNGGNN